MKRRILLCLLLTSYVLGLSACGNRTSSDTKATETSISSTVSEQQTPIEKKYNPYAYEIIGSDYTTDISDYEIAIKRGRIDPDTPKLTYADVKTIIKEVTDEIPDDGERAYIAQSIEIMKRIKDIQRIPDRSFDSYNSHDRRFYWPDANTERERRECIDITEYGIISEGCLIIYAVFDDNGECISSEILYNTLGKNASF